MNSKVEMVFWDVQHGHATYIKSPNNRHIVIDLGTGDYSSHNEAFSPLQHLKYKYHVNQLDYVIITHPHLDHINDILNFDDLSPKVLRRPHLTVQEIMENVRAEDEKKFKKYCEIENRYTNSIVGGPNDPDILNNYGGMKFETFSAVGCSHDNFNNQSIITVIEYANRKVVIPGDNEDCSFAELMQSASFKSAIKDADILLAPHHGRESGYNNDFVSLVNPRLTIVSDGRYCDTSANTRYSGKSRGWKVYKKNGTSSMRYCLTTNSDGEVYVEFGINSNGENYLQARID